MAVGQSLRLRGGRRRLARRPSLSGVHGTALAGAPGCARWRPETITWSPAAQAGADDPIRTLLASRRDVLARDLAVLADHHHVGALRVALHGELRNEEGVVLVPSVACSGDERAGQQVLCSGFGTRARSATAPVDGIDHVAGEVERARALVGRCRRAAAPAPLPACRCRCRARRTCVELVDAHREVRRTVGRSGRRWSAASRRPGRPARLR